MAKKINEKQELFENSEDTVIPQHLGKTIEENQLAYSDLVITGRALPSIYDGTKPVHKRLLYTFKHENYINKNIKSAKVVGSCIGAFHPHGDLANYEALVEMTQVFKNRFPLTVGQGNWGNIQGDSQGAQRYTEVKLNSEIANLLFNNIDKDGVVSWEKNYDDTIDEPKVLPTRFPIALLNGTMGIAYAGITTKIPSYNIKELAKFYIYLIDNKFWEEDFDVEPHKKDILKIIPGVDLATGTNIYFDGDDYSQEDMIFSSEFSFRMRATHKIDEKANTITFTNIPIDVLTDRLVNEIKDAGLSYRTDRNGKQIPKTDDSEILNIIENADVQSISSYKDKDYNNDAELTLTFKKGSNLELELIKVFKYTSLDSAYSARMRFIDANTCPVLVSLYQQTVEFLKFRLHTFYKAFQFDISKLEAQLHLLRGLRTIQEDLDTFINIVRNNEDDALYPLIKESFDLDDVQIEHLLSIQLRKLSKTSVTKVQEDIAEKEAKVKELEEKISSKDNLYAVVKADYEDQLTKSYMTNKKSNRITKMIKAQRNINKEDLIQDKEVIVMYMEDDTIAYVDKNKFKLKNKGTKTTANKINNDFELNLKISEPCMLKDTLLLMTNKGKVFKLKTYMFVEQFRYIGNLINLDKDERLVNILRYDEKDKYYCITTQKGKIKGVSKQLFKNTTSNRAIKSITLKDNDKVISFNPYQKDSDKEKIIILTNQGRVIKYPTTEITVIAGTGQGNKACALANKEEILKTFIFTETNETVLIGVSKIGRAKKTLTSKISDKKRVNAPNLFFNNNKENGDLICGEVFSDIENETLMVLTEKSDVSLLRLNGFNPVSRAAKGSIILLKMEEDEYIKICKKLRLEHLSDTQNEILQTPSDD